MTTPVNRSQTLARGNDGSSIGPAGLLFIIMVVGWLMRGGCSSEPTQSRPAPQNNSGYIDYSN